MSLLFTWCFHGSGGALTLHVCECVGAFMDYRKPNIHGRLSVTTGCVPPNLGVIFHTTLQNSPVSQSSFIWVYCCAICKQQKKINVRSFQNCAE